MKHLFKFYVLICAVVFISCEKETQTTPELSQIFNQEEIEDINTIVSYYEERLKAQANTEDIDAAFYEFGKQNTTSDSYDFSGFDKENLQDLYDKISAETYDEIWVENRGYNFELRDSISKYSIAYEKKFMDYLELIGQKNPKVNAIHDKVKAVGVVQGIQVLALYKDFDEDGRNGRLSQNIGDFNDRFIAAVFTIAVAENILQDEEVQKRLENKN